MAPLMLTEKGVYIKKGDYIVLAQKELNACGQN